jgi:hypothetical protein
MGYHPRIECKEAPSFLTTRSQNSELWFVNNPELERAILGYAARCDTRYEVKLYALALEGNHSQKAAMFPKGNRANFMHDFNSAVTRAVPRCQPKNGGWKSGLLKRRSTSFATSVHHKSPLFSIH